MGEKKILISIDENGNCDAKTFGIYGSECISELDKLLKELSLQTKTNKKDDFYKETKLINNGVRINNQ